MRRLEQNGEILRALLIFGTAIGITMIVGIHPVTGTTYDIQTQGHEQGESDCQSGKNSPNQGPNSEGKSLWYLSGYKNGWMDAGCVLSPPP
jgi:hypothetical protein